LIYHAGKKNYKLDFFTTNPMSNPKKNPSSNLIDSLKEYNKTLAEQISRIKTFIEDIDKQISYHKKLEDRGRHVKTPTPFSRDYLAYKARTNVN
jgi:hypothetical protein